MIAQLRLWWRLRRLRAAYAAHAPSCPAAPAFVPLWAVGVDYRGCTSVHHPPWPCAYETCGVPVIYSTRANRPKRGPNVYCSVAHKEARAHPAPIQREKGPAFTPGICPRPDKRAFDSEAEVRTAFRTLFAADGTLQAYLCRCWRWHAGHPSVDEQMTIANIARITHTKENQ